MSTCLAQHSHTKKNEQHEYRKKNTLYPTIGIKKKNYNRNSQNESRNFNHKSEIRKLD